VFGNQEMRAYLEGWNLIFYLFSSDYPLDTGPSWR